MVRFVRAAAILASAISASEQPKTVAYNTPQVPEGAHLFESFDAGIPASFVKTSGNKQDEDGGKYSGEIVAEAALSNALEGDLSMVLKSKAKHHGIAANLAQPFSFVDEEAFVMQYEVNFQDGIECGGAYVKLLSDEEGLDLSNFDDKTKFTFMFGPDKCSSDYKLHFIYNYKNPSGEFEEKHLKTKPKADVLKPAYTDAKPHLFRLVVNKDSTFEVSMDKKIVSSGSLLTDMDPSINPPAEIVDESDSKPEDWDDREMISDPDAVKPEDWDESAPKQIVDESAKMPSSWREDLEPLMDDPEAIMPEDWDEEMDGEYVPPQVDNPECKGIGCGAWEPPMIKNPAYKGKWAAKKIKNPAYKGVWKARMIANPDYFEDASPFSSAVNIKAMAVEVWTMSKDILFDNFYLGNSVLDADAIAAATFSKKVEQAKLNEPSLMEKTMKAAEENKTVVYVITAILGIPVLYILYKMLFKKKVEDVKEEEEEEKAPEAEYDMVDEEEENEAEEETEEIGAGDSKIEESAEESKKVESESENEESDSDDEPEPETKTLRQRKTRTRAD